MCSGSVAGVVRAGAEVLFDRGEEHAVGLGVVEGLAGLVDGDTPPSGMRKRTGPRIAFSFSAMNSPMARFSSTVVRISVTVAL